MTTLIQYLQRVLIVAIPAILVFLCFTPYRMKALSAMNLRTSHRHEAGLILFVTSIFGILALTLWPTYIWMDSPGVWGDIRILIDRPSWKSNLSLIPFTVFKDYIEDLFKTPVFFFATLINFFGDLAIFVPIGFFPALLFRDANWKRSAIIGFGMSALIELAQYFIMRNVAVDDIILNTAGAICGYLLYLFIRKHSSACALQAFICRTHSIWFSAFNCSVTPLRFASSGTISSMRFRAASSISAQCSKRLSDSTSSLNSIGRCISRYALRSLP